MKGKQRIASILLSAVFAVFFGMPAHATMPQMEHVMPQEDCGSGCPIAIPSTDCLEHCLQAAHTQRVTPAIRVQPIEFEVFLAVPSTHRLPTCTDVPKAIPPPISVSPPILKTQKRE